MQCCDCLNISILFLKVNVTSTASVNMRTFRKKQRRKYLSLLLEEENFLHMKAEKKIMDRGKRGWKDMVLSKNNDQK